VSESPLTEEELEQLALAVQLLWIKHIGRPVSREEADRMASTLDTVE
jgi:hypothetical protein